jgi:hypothetical protein
MTLTRRLCRGGAGVEVKRWKVAAAARPRYGRAVKAKTWLFVIVLAGVAVWAVWYYFIREPTLGEKIDGASRAVERSVNDAVRKITP